MTTEDERVVSVESIKAALRTDVYADSEKWHADRDADLDEWMRRGTNAGKVAPWAQDIDRLLRQVRAVRALVSHFGESEGA